MQKNISKQHKHFKVYFKCCVSMTFRVIFPPANYNEIMYLEQALNSMDRCCISHSAICTFWKAPHSDCMFECNDTVVGVGERFVRERLCAVNLHCTVPLVAMYVARMWMRPC